MLDNNLQPAKQFTVPVRRRLDFLAEVNRQCIECSACVHVLGVRPTLRRRRRRRAPQRQPGPADEPRCRARRHGRRFGHAVDRTAPSRTRSPTRSAGVRHGRRSTALAPKHGADRRPAAGHAGTATVLHDVSRSTDEVHVGASSDRRRDARRQPAARERCVRVSDRERAAESRRVQPASIRRATAVQVVHARTSTAS